jgi:hypothetical protein
MPVEVCRAGSTEPWTTALFAPPLLVREAALDFTSGGTSKSFMFLNSLVKSLNLLPRPFQK